MKKIIAFLFVFFLLMILTLQGPALAKVTNYKVPVISDFTGAYAELFKAWGPMQKAIFAWWNDTKGKEIGIELELKYYDSRYDSTVVASMWPGILAECHPIIALGAGGPDVAALQQRLPKDRVPVIYGTASYGYGWLPNQWLFQVRPTYVQEFMAAFVWYAGQHPEKKPILSCCSGPRELLLKAIKFKLEVYNGKKPTSKHSYVKMLYEPGRGGGQYGRRLKTFLWESKTPILDVGHDKNSTKTGCRPFHNYVESLEPYGHYIQTLEKFGL